MNIVTNNWKMKLTSLVLAIVLWSHVRGEVNPWEEATFQVPLQVHVPANMIALNRDKIPATVKVKLRGPRLTLRELKGATPPNPLALADDASPLVSDAVIAELDFTLARRGEQNLPIKAVSRDEDLEVSSVKPSDIVVVLDKAAHKRIAVQPLLRIATGYRIDNVSIQAQEVVVSGPANVLERVATVRARLRSGVLRLNVPRQVTVPLEAVDDEGEPVEGVRLEPSQTIATGTLREERIVKRIRAALRIEGTPAAGYRIEESSVTPSSIRVRGSQSVLKSLDQINIPFSVDGLSGSVRRRVTIDLPVGIVPESAEQVMVDVSIVPRTPASPKAPAASPVPRPTENAPLAPPATAAPVAAVTPLARRAE